MAFFRKKKQGDVRQKQPRQGKKQPQQHGDEAYTAESMTILAARTSSSVVSPPASEDSVSMASLGQKLVQRTGRQNSANSARSLSRDRRSSNKKTPLTTETTTSSHNSNSALASIFGNHLHHNSSRGHGNHHNHNSSASILLNSLNIVATDDIEITTYESQQALVEQREAIRRQLFDPPSDTNQHRGHTTANNNNGNAITSSPTSFLRKQQQIYGTSGRTILYRTATNASQEILPNGSIIPDNTHYRGNKLSSPSTEQFSLPLSYVSQSFASSASSNGADHHDNNHNMEDSIDYSTSRIVPIELAARSYDDSMVKNKNSKQPLSSPDVPDAMMTRARTDPQEQRDWSMSTTTLSPLRSLDIVPNESSLSLPLTPPAAVPEPAQQQPITPGSTGTLPMDERRVDRELEYQRNRGKSPLKGMPDDERREYQRDEIDARNDDDDENVVVEVHGQHEEDDEGNDSNEEGEEDEEGEEVSEFSERAPTATTKGGLGLLGRGAFVAAAIGWGANAVDSACFGEEDDLLDDATEREIPTGTLSSSNHTKQQQQQLQRQQHSNARPVYLNDAECKKFLRRITRNGFVLLNLVVNEESSWTGRTVTMCIAKGSQEHPAQLEWTTVTGGLNHEIAVSSVDLMDILTIDSDGIPDNNDPDDDAAANATSDNSCIFTITTDDGHVFLFEANSKEERDRIVHGLKTIIARWARQMVAGDVTATTELYAAHQPPKLFAGRNTELAMSPSPTYTMNRLAHRLLDL